MNAIRITTVVGARPQFVKASAVSRALARRLARIGEAERPVVEQIIHTGQHYDPSMSEVFFEELGLPRPNHNLEVGSGPHGKQTGQMLERIEAVLIDDQPDAVLVYGDTNSTLAGALAAVKLHLPLLHVEAGLRSGRMDMPEEVNRTVTDRISTILYCPTATSADNLAHEGIIEGVEVVGDVMLDILQWRRATSTLSSKQLLDDFGVEAGGYALATVHRAENTDDPERLAGIRDGLARIAAAGVPVLLPLHPRARGRLGSWTPPAGLRLLEPLPYGEMLELQAQARCVVTDSGGVQKEALWLAVPCITLRDETEWPETVAAGWNVLVGADPDLIVHFALSTDERPTAPPPLYGDGSAADRIVDSFVRHLA